MDSIDEIKNRTSPLRSPSLRSAGGVGESARTIMSNRSMSIAPPSRSGRSSPLPEMCVTEQIARKTRKSTVLNEKNALMILAIPDYEDYKIVQPYSCRSLSSKSKFVGGKDFITRHNPQAVNDFKKEYSRDVGNLNRHRSIAAPPNALLSSDAGSPPGGKTFAFLASQSLKASSSNQGLLDPSEQVWKRIFTAGNKPCWILTEFGINKLIGPEYRITTRLPLMTAREEPTPLTCRSPLRPDSPFASFTARDSARIGMGIDLLNENCLGSLSRTWAYSPASRPPDSPRSPYRETLSPAETARLPSREATSRRSESSSDSRPSSRSDYRLGSPYLEQSLLSIRAPSISPLKSPQLFPQDASHVTSPTLLPFAMELSPPQITLGTIESGEVYLFPIRVRNIGSKQERYRVKYVSASAGGHVARIAEGTYDKETARLAPGLAAIVTLTLSFQHRGHITGQLCVDTEGVGTCELAINGVVR